MCFVRDRTERYVYDRRRDLGRGDPQLKAAGFIEARSKKSNQLVSEGAPAPLDYTARPRGPQALTLRPSARPLATIPTP